MIPLSEIDIAVKKFHVPPETIEKDYVISWILSCLSKSKLSDNFVFYGGTAIKRIYFEDHRFSEDIDLFSSKYFNQDYILEQLDILRYASEKTNLLLEVDKNTIIAHENRIQLYILYSGYEEIAGVPKQVRIDFAMNMHPYGKNENKKIIKSYSDLKLQNETLSVMALNTILANKLGLLTDSTRNEPRDLFDIWFLLQRTTKFDFHFDEVCKAFRDKYGYCPSWNVLKPRLNNPSFKKLWDARLNKQIAELPDIEMIINEIEKGLEKFFEYGSGKNEELSG